MNGRPIGLNIQMSHRPSVGNWLVNNRSAVAGRLCSTIKHAVMDVIGRPRRPFVIGRSIGRSVGVIPAARRRFPPFICFLSLSLSFRFHSLFILRRNGRFEMEISFFLHNDVALMRIDSSKQRARAPANLMQMYANEPDATSTANSVKKTR